MSSSCNIVREKLLEYGSLIEIIKKNGIKRIIDFAASSFLDLLSKRFRGSNDANCTLSQAFFHSRDLDRWSRYVHVANEMAKTKARISSVLDVGSGGQSISRFFAAARKDCNFFSLDVRKQALKDLRWGHAVLGDGRRLPFRDEAFDMVVSVDTAEHIPKSVRRDFYKELRRVCNMRMIFTCPIQSNDGIFQGRNYDVTFQYLYKKTYGAKEPNTRQHIASGHPTLQEIKKALPNSAIYGYKNCDVWLKYMLFSPKPLVGLFSGLLYYLFWKKSDDKPPFWGAMVVSN